MRGFLVLVRGGGGGGALGSSKLEYDSVEMSGGIGSPLSLAIATRMYRITV
jgi:hypothetical protein